MLVNSGINLKFMPYQPTSSVSGKDAVMADLEAFCNAAKDTSLYFPANAFYIDEGAGRIAAGHGARVAVAEVPPGPPVLQTLVAEIYGPNETSRQAFAAKVKEIFQNMIASQ